MEQVGKPGRHPELRPSGRRAMKFETTMSAIPTGSIISGERAVSRTIGRVGTEVANPGRGIEALTHFDTRRANG
jgi:hypothetical protein